MDLVRLSWRNLWRSKRRTLITSLSVAGAVWMATTFLGIAEWAYNDMVGKSATMGFGHVSVAAPGYNDDPSISKRIANAESMAKAASAARGVQAVVPRVVGQGLFATARKTTGGLLLGIDPKRDTAERNLFVKKLEQGTALLGKDGKVDDGGCIIGARMAKTLQLELGSKLVWTATDVEGEIVSEVARVRGIFQTGVAEVDMGTVLLPIDKARRVLKLGPEAATILAVFNHEHRASAAVRDAVSKAVGPGVEVKTWQQTQPAMASYVQVDRASNEIFQLLIGLVVAAGILNTMLMGVLERRRELGVLLAIGMRPRRLFALVILESVWVGLLGLVLGGLLVLPWAYFLYSTGIDLSGMMTEQLEVGGVVFDMTLHLRLADAHYFVIPFAVFCLTIGAALYPALKAARLEPIESLRVLD